AIWPSRKLNLGQLADHLRVSFDGGPEAAPLRVDPKASAIVGAELQARIVFARPQVAPTRQVTLLLRDLPTRDAVVRLKFAPALFTDEASTADKDR
ncbi:MAG: hypothetical protein HY303_09405, partial [Candidatus Wallbacteria bacterium]|nr:hypothetical protein [Candidatus Wallbacteria bacterium]